MKNYKNKTYTERVKLRIRLLWIIFILMLVYMVVIGEMGKGDSRLMTDLAETTSRLLFFGGLGFVIIKIVQNKKLLKNKLLLNEILKEETDERMQFLHDKSGGIVVDILILVLLFITCTAALCNIVAFHISFGILIVTIALKVGSYVIYNKNY